MSFIAAQYCDACKRAASIPADRLEAGALDLGPVAAVAGAGEDAGDVTGPG